MIGIIFTWDYEIYGNGLGNPLETMIRPTERLLTLLEQYGCKLSIFAEVAEILKFEEYYKHNGSDRFYSAEIIDQLKRSLSNGNDVQLHLHPQWFNATYVDEQWRLDFNEYSLGKIPYLKINRYIKTAKKWLEECLINTKASYKCIAFRAGNWAIQPSKNIVKCLKENEIYIDSSVFKWGYAKTEHVDINYLNAFHNFYSWYVDENDINLATNKKDTILEMPIFSLHKPVFSFLNAKEIKVQLSYLKNKRKKSVFNKKAMTQKPNLQEKLVKIPKALKGVRWRYPKKFDFGKLSFGEMKGMLNYVIKHYNTKNETLYPLVLIAHSKDFELRDDLKKILNYINETYSKEEIRYITFTDYLHYLRC